MPAAEPLARRGEGVEGGAGVRVVTCSLEVRETAPPPLAQHGFGTPTYGSPVHTYAHLPPEYDYHPPVAAYVPPVHARTLIRAPRSGDHPGSGANTSLPQHDQPRPTTLPLSQQARTASRSSSDMARLSHNISAILENLLKNYNNQVRPGYHEGPTPPPYLPPPKYPSIPIYITLHCRLCCVSLVCVRARTRLAVCVRCSPPLLLLPYPYTPLHYPHTSPHTLSPPLNHPHPLSPTTYLYTQIYIPTP
ncbi:hypothetical protein C7M84_014499 [Penaeus vannamei]|uniref:Uncharacterized protein n=1 Tax=Penaeus vannamei TaxID=6689 RepID=A0A3R7LXT6_PENVA|nr:hypothetical protein C7M84_014499 [Penaeus vannamei]